MEIISKRVDQKIGSLNVLSEISISEYEELIQNVVNNNEFQRKKVRSSKSVYSLLKADLLQGCIIPPIVLALTTTLSNDCTEKTGDEELLDILKKHQNDLVILDGLQRTITILDLLGELRVKDDSALDGLLNSTIRLEFYIGINRIGILYRMLTLNTGQTPMSLRQQVEMLYLDYSGTKIAGVNIIREVDGKGISQLNDYNFKELIEGYLAYLEKSPLPIDRGRLLDDIASIDKLSMNNLEEGRDVFNDFISALHLFTSRVDDLTQNVRLDTQYEEENGKPFGYVAVDVFKRSQAIAAFGASIAKLLDIDVINSFSELESLIGELSLSDPLEFLVEINTSLNWIKNNSTKIGNSQREYFVWFFRELFNKDSDSFLDLIGASISALSRYKSVNH